VVAGMTVAGEDEGGVGAEPCSLRAARRWFLPDGATTRGRLSGIVVMNPFDSEAVLDVTLAGDAGEIRPGSLKGVVLAPRRSIAFSLNRFALGEEALGAAVEVSLGRVAAASVGSGDTSLRLALGAPAPSRTWTLPGLGYTSSSVNLMTPGASSVPFSARLSTSTDQRVLLEEETASAGQAVRYPVVEPDASVAIESAGDSPLVASRRFALERGLDQAASGGTPLAASDWVAVPAVGAWAGEVRLAIANPGMEPASVDLSYLTAEGPREAAEIASVDVPPGRSVSVDLSASLGEDPAAVVARATSGRIVAGLVGASEDGYWMALGARIDSFSEAPSPGMMERP
ncbi:MAG: DUF5719 family protein, partial [Actinomycetota bacterium]|nr:DUF5719 family protein [Actinomycetota bacterium]